MEDDQPANNLSELCQTTVQYKFTITVTDIATLVLGHPMSVRLLWVTLISKHRDILNANLAFFYTLLYCGVYIHMFSFFFSAKVQLPQLIQKFLIVFVQVGGPMQMYFICVERFIAVLHPTHFPLLKKYKCREIGVALVWLSSLPLAVLYCLPSMDQILEKLSDFLTSLMCIFSGIMVYASIRVAIALRISPTGKRSLHPGKRRAFIIICVTTVTTIGCYIPVMIMDRYRTTEERLYICRLVPVCILLLSSASLVHLAFYLYTKGQFRCKIKLLRNG